MKTNKFFLKKTLLTFTLISLLLILASCSPATNETTEAITTDSSQMTSLEEENSSLQSQLEIADNQILELEDQIATLTTQIESEPAPSALSSNVLMSALDVAQALKDKDMAILTSYVHPSLGVRFTPYGYVDTVNDLNFSAGALSALLGDPTLYTWGAYDGSGDPINLNFNDYLDEFVYDEDYVSPHLIGINTVIGTGNSINNISTEYSGSTFVEFHFTGFDPQYGGIDWSSLILVFDNVGGDWKLVGIVHNQWTI
ncbi:hypothetical protein QE109_04040 [Fusibacter bizertensis]|jgi:hypothetical protein|uniref:Uncharacterized protein n=1 Tax=Fusibacter bizertensis TaxID=1488331 RepID=A0ABT6NA56_9FIRM|nr:hypothetical protein [Fusibacter bizertensis]MDH8677303.1 hypothetical protein [Fusibacter bizertensis]